MISKHTLEGIYTYASPACRPLLGYEPEELIGRYAYDFFHPEDLSQIRKSHSAILELPDTRTVSYRIRRKDGAYTWFETNSRTVREEDTGEALEIIAISRDISQRKQAEEDLREAEERFRSAFDNTAVGMALVNLEGRYMRVNYAMCEILGYSEEDFLSMTYRDLTYHEDYEVSMEYVRRINQENLDSYSLEKRYVHAEGHPVWVSLSVSLLKDAENRPLYYISQAQDITERKLAEEELRDNTRLLSEVIAIQQEIATADLDYKAMMQLITERSQRLTGAHGAVIELIEDEDLFYYSGSGTSSEHVGLRLKLSSSMSGRCVREGKPLLSEDTEIDPRVDREACRRTGARSLIVVPLYYAQETVGVLKVASGKPHAFDDRDVNALQIMAGLIAATMSHAAEFEAKQNLLAERTASLVSIQQSEARFRAIFEDTAAGIALVGIDGCLFQTNPALQKMLGYSNAELEGTHISNLTHPDNVAEDLAHYRELVAGKQDNYELEKRYVRKDGGFLWGRLNVSLVRNHLGTPQFTIGMVEEITERKRAEQEIRQRALQQASVAQLGQRALARTNVSALMNEAVSMISRTLETEYASVLKLLPQQDQFLLQAGVGWDADQIGKITVGADKDWPAGQALANGQVVFEDLNSETRFTKKHVLQARGVVSGMYVAIQGQEGPFGALGTYCTQRREFSKDDVNFIQSVANVLATAMERRRYEEALEKSSREYRRLFEMANDAIVVYDPGSREILDVNENACKMYQLTKETFLGKTMKEVSLDRQRARRYLETLLDQDSYQNFETVHRRSDGVPINVLVNSSIIEFGGRRAVLSIARDVTDRKRTEQSLHEMREAERRRIARDLHDVVLQDLSGALQALQATQLESNGSDEVELDREIEALRRAVGGLRGAVYDLRIEKEQPFLKSVQSLVELNRQMTPERLITLTVKDGFPQDLESGAGLELVRVLQEALANTRNHSGARRVEVTLSKEDRELRAEVTDDGCGFDSYSKSNGVGLSGMRERALELGGRLEIHSEPGKGTSVKVKMSL